MDAVLWRPPEDVFMGRFAARNGFGDYEALQRWSVSDLEAPVKRILRGAAPDSVASRGALADQALLMLLWSSARGEEDDHRPASAGAATDRQ